jgi:16S rRNA G966 N2-methylase RsmD
MTEKTFAQRYDRAFLLSEAKRNQVMELWEVQKFGVDSYGDAEYVCIYGMSPTEWHRRGVRLLARTTVEAVRDRLGNLIGQDVERLVHDAASRTTFRVIDPFAGSCNALYWILRHLPGSNGVGFEIDETIFEMTRRNLPSVDRRIELIRGDYKPLLDRHRAPSAHVIVVFLAPPWGDALTDTGLDLRRTKPPVAEIVDDFERIFKENRVLYVTQLHQSIEPVSLTELRQRFDSSELRIYDINVEGMKPGVLLGKKRWAL